MPSCFRGFRLISFLLLLSLLFSCRNFFQSPLDLREEVTIVEAAEALEFSKTKMGSDYEWASNGPYTFDCSGLIVWSYQQIAQYEYIFSDGSGLTDDINMNTMYNHNVRLLSFDEVVPGDVIFITDDPDTITHGGLVVETMSSSVTFIHASSYNHEVRTDTWSIDDTTRGQWIEGFGRMIIRK